MELITSDHEVHNQVKLVSGLEGIVELNDEWRVHIFQDFSLGLGVNLLITLLDSVLSEDFHGVYLAT